MPTAALKVKPTIRLATPYEGPVIHEILAKSGRHAALNGIDWNQDVSPYWLVAEWEEQIVGCLQVNPGRPLGRLDWLGVLPDLSHRVKAEVVKALLVHGMESCRAMGAQAVAGVVDETLPEYAMMLKHRGAVPWFSGIVYVKGV